MLGEIRMGAEVIAALRELNAFCCGAVHVHALLVLVRLKKGLTRSEKPWINHW